MPLLTLLFDSEINTDTPIPAQPAFSYSIDFVVDLFNYQFIKIIVEQGKIEALILICVTVVIVFFLKNLFRYLALFFLTPLRNLVVRDIRRDLFDKLLSLPIAYFSEERKGDILTRITSDVQEIEHSIISTLEATFKEPATIIIFLGAMLYISPELTVFVFVMIAVTGTIVGQIGKSLKNTSLKGQNKLGDLISMVEESISGLRIVKAFNAEDYQAGKLAKENDEHARIVTRMLRQRDLSSPLSEFLGIGIVVTVLWFGGRLVLNPENGMQAQTFIGFMVIFSQLISPAKSFSTAFYNIQRGLASVERVRKILDAENNIVEQKDAKEQASFEQELEFKNVSFAYYHFDDRKVLDQINFKVKKGKTIAIVGQSGAGKSTLVDLIPRFYDPVEGQILIDGEDIKSFKLKALRSMMGIVSQEPILFNDTVHNNISFSAENISKEDVIRAAKIANAHEFITKLENGYDTYIGDRGGKLSGGERQRLTIARAVLSDPAILILDEATSSLDTQSEKLVQDAIGKLMENRTAIVIAHRLSTIQSADEIIVLNEGKIVERGSHDELMSHGGTYKKLVNLQAF